MNDLDLRRRFFAEELEATTNLRTAGLVEALATVPREQFLPPGPWLIFGEGDIGGGPRQTPAADPSRVYHNVSFAIDPSRQLFNGGPSTVARAIDALALNAGERVLHLGCGLGYYTAIIAQTVGPSGHVVAIEVDEALAERARANLSGLSWVETKRGDGREPLVGVFDAILINAGITHAPDSWLDALVAGGRMVLPVTASMPAMGTIGKGLMVLLVKNPGGDFSARTLNMVGIYSAVGVRDDSMNAGLGKALMGNPFPRLTRLR